MKPDSQESGFFYARWLHPRLCLPLAGIALRSGHFAAYNFA